MTKIEELLKDLCPNGVEWKTLGEVFDTKNGYTPSKSKSEFWENGTVPWFRMEDIRENGRILDKSIQYVSQTAVKGGKLFKENSIIVATSATIGEHALITVPFLSNQRFTVLTLKENLEDNVNMKFMYYYCFLLDEWCKHNVSLSSFASVDMTGFRKVKIPLPPLEIQKEIVKILDKFTEYVTELTAELTAELTFRKKQ
ncbi:restriction endonuclease subunit S, partial [Streptococcus sciuri]